MIDTTSLIWAGTMVLAVFTISAAALVGWLKWLDVRRYEIERGSETEFAPELSAAARIEIANLRERLRKLEAIASGLDP